MDCCAPVNLRENTRGFIVTACESYVHLYFIAWTFDGILSRHTVLDVHPL